MSILEIKQLYMSFGNNKVLTGLDMAVPENSIFGFVGKNGVGKTTTMKIVLGLLKADSGSVSVCGEKVVYG
ncbi:MAG TPA: ATP-binding cassette domain-containing protein, partial [Limnochordia bacterium]|nr:ATP-binding cassette domain-containing protein [Limnochordia bacterium]